VRDVSILLFTDYASPKLSKKPRELALRGYI